MITYQKIHKKHFSQITKIWKYGLKDNLHSILGINFINEYIKLILNNNKNKAFIAIDKKKNKVVGFVIFGKENGVNLKIFNERFLNIIFIIIKKIFFFQIKDLLKFFDVLVYLLISSFHNLKFNRSIELLIIVVEETNRSKKIGGKLVNKSISDLKKENKKLKFINVVTLSKLKKSINFYKKNKFRVAKKVYNRLHMIRAI